MRCFFVPSLAREHPPPLTQLSDEDATIDIFQPISIGRVPSNDIVVNSNYLSVSGRHAQFEFAFVKQGWSSAGVAEGSGKLRMSIKDLDSTQGTHLFVRDDRGQVYLKELTQGQAYRIDRPPPLRSSGVVSVPSQLVLEEHQARYGPSCVNTKLAPRLEVIGVQMGTVVFAFQSTKQPYAWDFVAPERGIIRPMTSERAPLPCVDQYLDYFFAKNDYVRLL